MAAILLTEMDPKLQAQIKTKLQKKGHKVWLAHQLSEIDTILKAAAIQLMIVDLDEKDLDLLTQVAGRWKGIKILFQASDSNLKQDFRTWIADEFICKSEDGENINRAVTQLLN